MIAKQFETKFWRGVYQNECNWGTTVVIFKRENLEYTEMDVLGPSNSWYLRVDDSTVCMQGVYVIRWRVNQPNGYIKISDI
jgi:hypothetical protein